MSRIRTVFLGTPEIARSCLEAMIKDPHFEIVGVVTQPDRPAGRKLQLQPSPVKELVQPLGIPVLSPENINTPEVMDQIAAFKAEVAVVVAFGQILKKPFLKLFPDKVVNVHASVLPRWRGAAPIQRALMAGDLETGVCLQVMVRKLDAGAVLGTRRFALTPEMNAFDSYKKCEELGAKLLEVDLMDYLRGNLTPHPQDEAQVTYAHKIDKAESEIDWTKPAEEIHNLVRGLAMGPVPQTHRHGKIVKIHRTRIAALSGGSPGSALKSPEKTLIVQCGTGSLEILEAQPESRAKMPIEEYLRGYPVKPGDQFGGSK
jgi:methionyl-tRNA formyltransferase